MGMVEVDHKRKSDNRLSIGRSNQSCPQSFQQPEFSSLSLFLAPWPVSSRLSW